MRKLRLTQIGKVLCFRSQVQYAVGLSLYLILWALLSDIVLGSQYSKHLFVHISQSSPSYSDPYLETVDIRQIYDKFPEKKGGLKELFERGPSNAFFLVKFWVSPGPLFP